MTADTPHYLELPHVVYGRLLESAHISGYSFERVCSELEWLLEEDRWRSVGPGYEHINAFVQSVDLSPFNMEGKQLKNLARKVADLGASERATAKMLGTGKTTVHEALNGRGRKRPVAGSAPEPEQGEPRADGRMRPSEEWFERGHADVVRPAKGRTDRLARDRQAESRRQERASATAEAQARPRRIDLRCGDFREVLADVPAGSVDAIITDPPYGRKWLPSLADLATLADRLLQSDGVLAVLFGQAWLPQAFNALCSGGRQYRWTACYLTEGSGYAAHDRSVQSMWKPVLVFGGGRRFGDVVRNEDSDSAAKANHEWGQGIGGFLQLVEILTEPGHVVCDPMMGAGTTLAAAVALGRHALGCDLEPEHVATAANRMRVSP